MYTGFPSSTVLRNLPAIQEMQETWVQSPGWVDPLQEEMATHSSILAWRIPWAEEPGGLQSMLQRFRHESTHSCILSDEHTAWFFSCIVSCISLTAVMLIIFIIWLYSLQPKMEKLYTVSKNKTRSWLWLRSVQFSSVAQSCLTLCDLMNCSTARPPCPSPTSGVHPNPCPLCR